MTKSQRVIQNQSECVKHTHTNKIKVGVVKEESQKLVEKLT
jgi:hypothetical protein